MIERCPEGRGKFCALDLGASNSPYKGLLEAEGYTVKTLDITRKDGADFAGTVEETGLEDESFELVLCTQVLEHCLNPWQGIKEIQRILKPSGILIASVPHVWFYHPHPTDNWRFTQEGIVHLCRMGSLRPDSLLSQGGSVTAFFQVANFLAYGVPGAPRSSALLHLELPGRPDRSGAFQFRILPEFRLSRAQVASDMPFGTAMRYDDLGEGKATARKSRQDF